MAARNVRLYHGDCLKIMLHIKPNSVDLVLADPPYGTTACRWDTTIPFEPMWEQLKRIIKPKSNIVLFGVEPFASVLRCSNLKGYKYDWVWVKNPTNFLNAKKQPLRKTERISVFEGCRYYPQNLIYKPRIVRRSNSTATVGLHGATNLSKYINYPNDVLNYKSERGLHPTQKPVVLMEYLIKTYSNLNDVVLDFTMGSGTTGVACRNLKRKFIGIELDPKYFKIAQKRIEEAKP